MENLPIELLTSILLLLDGSAAFKYTLVCKTWNSILSRHVIIIPENYSIAVKHIKSSSQKDNMNVIPAHSLTIVKPCTGEHYIKLQDLARCAAYFPNIYSLTLDIPPALKTEYITPDALIALGSLDLEGVTDKDIKSYKDHWGNNLERLNIVGGFSVLNICVYPALTHLEICFANKHGASTEANWVNYVGPSVIDTLGEATPALTHLVLSKIYLKGLDSIPDLHKKVPHLQMLALREVTLIEYTSSTFNSNLALIQTLPAIENLKEFEISEVTGPNRGLSLLHNLNAINVWLRYVNRVYTKLEDLTFSLLPGRFTEVSVVEETEQIVGEIRNMTSLKTITISRFFDPAVDFRTSDDVREKLLLLLSKNKDIIKLERYSVTRIPFEEPHQQPFPSVDSFIDSTSQANNIQYLCLPIVHAQDIIPLSNKFENLTILHLFRGVESYELSEPYTSNGTLSFDGLIKHNPHLNILHISFKCGITITNPKKLQQRSVVHPLVSLTLEDVILKSPNDLFEYMSSHFSSLRKLRILSCTTDMEYPQPTIVAHFPTTTFQSLQIRIKGYDYLKYTECKTDTVGWYRILQSAEYNGVYRFIYGKTHEDGVEEEEEAVEENVEKDDEDEIFGIQKYDDEEEKRWISICTYQKEQSADIFKGLTTHKPFQTASWGLRTHIW